MNRNLKKTKHSSTQHAFIWLLLTRGQDQTIPASDTPGASPALKPPAGKYASVGAQKQKWEAVSTSASQTKTKGVPRKIVRMTVSGVHIQRQKRKKGISTHAPKRGKGVSAHAPKKEEAFPH